MKKDTKKGIIVLAVYLILMLSIASYSFWRVHKEKKLIEKEGICVEAIFKKYRRITGGYIADYEFRLNDSIYHGHDWVGSQIGLLAGDTCKIIYAKSNPSISCLVKNEKGFVITVNQKQ